MRRFVRSSSLDAEAATGLRVARDNLRPCGVSLRTHVAFRRGALTRQLAEGADPATSPELALRARQLILCRHRRKLARALRKSICEATHPVTGRIPPLLSRRQVIDAADALDLLIKRLHSPVPVSPEGMALADRIVTDGGWSPLYLSGEPGSLRRLAIWTTTALDTGEMVEG